MNVKRRLSIAVLFSIFFMFTSSMFMNCSSKKFVSQSATDLTDAIQFNFSEGVEVIKIVEMPRSLTADVNGIVRYEIVAEKLEAVDFVEYKINSENWKVAYEPEILLTSLMNGSQKISFRATSKYGSQSDEVSYI